MSLDRPSALVVAALACACSVASGCTDRCSESAALPGDARILAIGDSILAWSGDRCESIPDQAALLLGKRIVNAAVNGARVLGGDSKRPAIPDQVVDAPNGTPWDEVIIDGGGNDLNATCACGDCDRVLDSLVSADGSSGAVPNLVDRISATGARVLLVDYYVLHDDAWYGFDRCGPALASLQSRYHALVDSRQAGAGVGPGAVDFVDLGDVVTPEATPDAYAFDNVHPSDKGTAVLGALVADRIRTPTLRPASVP